MAHALGLITLAGILFCLSVNRVSNARPARADVSPRTSPSPMATPQPEENKRPNVVRRFFSMLKDAITRPFRRQHPPISDPPIIFIKPSSSLLKFCPQDTGSPDCPADREVELYASSGDPSADAELLFTWTITAGRLRGEGQKVTWDLSGVKDGSYTARVEVNDDDQHIAVAETQVTIAKCQSCITLELETPCPTINVVCPALLGAKQPFTFEAQVHGGDPDFKITYSWSISSGKIVKGQDTSKITVDASDSGDESITATVKVGGTHPLCNSKAVCMTFISKGEMGRSRR